MVLGSCPDPAVAAVAADLSLMWRAAAYGQPDSKPTKGARLNFPAGTYYGGGAGAALRERLLAIHDWRVRSTVQGPWVGVAPRP